MIHIITAIQHLTESLRHCSKSKYGHTYINTCKTENKQTCQYNCLHIKLKRSYGKLSLVAQMVKNLPAMQDTWVQSLGQDDPLKKGMSTHSSILAWKILLT